MRRLMLFAALAASMLCHGEEDNNVDWWFTPQKWVDSEKIEIQLTKADGSPVGPITVHYGNNVADIAAAIEKKLEEKGSAPQAYVLATKALAQAIFSRLENKRQDEKILTLAKSIDVTLLGDTYAYVDSEGNKIEMRRTADYNEVKDAILQARQFVTGSKPSNEDDPIEIKLKNSVFDKNMLECVATPECENGDKLWTLKGFYSANKLNNFWTCENNYKYYAIPMFEGNNGYLTGSLNWYYFGGVDLGSLYSSSDENDPMYNKLTLRGWNEPIVLNKTLSTLLTSNEAADREDATSIAVLVRKSDIKDNSIKNTLEYVELGDIIDTSVVPPDEGSIQTYINADGTKTNLTLYGFNDNIPKERIEGANIPYVSADSRQEGKDPVLLWGGMENFVSETVFKKSETSGKLILNGTSEKGKFSVLAIQTGEGEEAEQTLATFSGDGISIDFGYTPDGGTFQKYAQLHNFDDPTREGASTDKDFADILTNKIVETDGWYVPLRTDTGLQYAPLKKITASDSSSVGLDCEPEKSLLDMFPIYTNNVDGVVKLGLQNWETPDNITGVYGKKEDAPVMWRMDDSKSLECDTTYATIEIRNSVAAGNRAIPFKDKSNPEGDTISWLAPPSENTSGKYLKMTGTGENATLSWESAAVGGVLLVEGNDGSSAICTNTLKFASAGDSNIKFNVTRDDAGNVTVTIGVYYIQESNLNGGSGSGL